MVNDGGYRVLYLSARWTGGQESVRVVGSLIQSVREPQQFRHGNVQNFSANAFPPRRLDGAVACRRQPGSAVRPFCPSDDYWQVYFDMNRAISRFIGGLETNQQPSAG